MYLLKNNLSHLQTQFTPICMRIHHFYSTKNGLEFLCPTIM